MLGKDNTPDRVSFFINSLWGRGAYFFEAIKTVGMVSWYIGDA